MERLYEHSGAADRAWLAEELPGPGRPLTLEDRADCCPALPVVTVIMPPSPGRPLPADLRLCGHHYRASSATLRAAGASMYDARGAVIAPEDDGSLTARGPVPAPPSAAPRPSHARRGRL
jgi:hypothetical protein